MNSMSSTADTQDREIVISRVFDAPRELVWQAMTDPQHVVHWWGPRGFSTTIEEMDVKPGGVWKHVMHGPGGIDYPNKSIFKEVVKPERIVFSHGGGRKGAPGAVFEATWSFDALDPGKTKVTIRMVFPSVEARDKVVKEYGAIEGGKQTLERLAEHLPKMARTAQEVVITRVLNAPCEVVFKAWTDPVQMVQWWSPEDIECRSVVADAKVGGAYRIHMASKEGDHIAFGNYTQLVPDKRLQFTWQWENNDMPQTMVTVEFEGLGKTTRLTLTHAGFVTNEDASDHNGGWSTAIEKFARLIEHDQIQT